MSGFAALYITIVFFICIGVTVQAESRGARWTAIIIATFVLLLAMGPY